VFEIYIWDFNLGIVIWLRVSFLSTIDRQPKYN